jgi:UDP-N-acetyl-D-mannosaminuronate dehydrogenase
MYELIIEALKEKTIPLHEAAIAILGLAFIENSDDPRNTPAFLLYNMLKKTCREVIIHDPHITVFENISITRSLETALRGRDCIALVTRHNEYLEIQPEWIKELVKTPILVDGRNVFNKKLFEEKGFTFRGVGIPKNST